jgi:hypothetical protein
MRAPKPPSLTCQDAADLQVELVAVCILAHFLDQQELALPCNPETPLQVFAEQAQLLFLNALQQLLPRQPLISLLLHIGQQLVDLRFDLGIDGWAHCRGFSRSTVRERDLQGRLWQLISA